MIRRKKTPDKSLLNIILNDDKKKIQKIVDSLSEDWRPEERETGILFDHHEKVVYLETSFGPTARRWFKNLWGDPEVKFDEHADILKITVPWDYCRRADLILKANVRQFDK